MTLPALAAFDGDDTLWHNEPLFWATQDRFRELLAPYCPPDHLSERLLHTEVANLKLFGYGIKGFVLSMIETAIEVSGGAVPASVIGELVARGKDMLVHPAHPLDGAAQTVAAVKAMGIKVMVITKGDLIDQESKLARSGMGELFDAVEVVSEKDRDLYDRLFRRHGAEPSQSVMIGNSVRSDVIPALEAGAWAAHIPYSGATWAHEHAEAPLDHPRFCKLERLPDLVGWLRTL